MPPHPRTAIDRGDTVRIFMPWPPSINGGYWVSVVRKNRRGGHYVAQGLGNDGKKYRKLSQVVCMKQQIVGLFGTRPVSLDIHWHPQKSDTDIDNFSKALFDGMEKAGVWDNDRQIIHRTDQMRKSIKGGLVLLHARLANESEIAMHQSRAEGIEEAAGLW